MRTLYLCGAGNSEGVRLALQVNARTARWDRIVLLDDDPAKQGTCRLDVPVVGPVDALHDADPAISEVANLVARATRSRRAVRDRILSTGVPFVALVSPDVDVAGVTVGRDVIVYQNATLGPETILEDGACVFMGAVVGHEVVWAPVPSSRPTPSSMHGWCWVRVPMWVPTPRSCRKSLSAPGPSWARGPL